MYKVSSATSAECFAPTPPGLPTTHFHSQRCHDAPGQAHSEPEAKKLAQSKPRFLFTRFFAYGSEWRKRSAGPYLRGYIGLTLLAALLLLAALACQSRVGDNRPAPPPGPSAGITSPAVAGGPVRALVVSVLDGVTIEAWINGHNRQVRYMGVATAAGMEGRAYEFNRFMVEGKVVELVPGVTESDLEGNLLMYAYASGQMVNEALLNNGLAVVASYPDTFEHKTAFLLAQAAAESSGRGVWASASAQARPTSVPQFGGTLPPVPTPSPSASAGAAACDFSNSPTPVIKGVAGGDGSRTYHVPGDASYYRVNVDESRGDRWFCTEADALEAGWSKAQ